MAALDFAFDEVLLGDLYQSALLEPPDSFQQSALRQLDKLIGFDQAWWGIMSPAKVGFQLRSSFRHELPLAFEEHWRSVNGDDTLALNVQLKPRTTIHYQHADLYSTPGLKSLNGEQHIRQALCTSIFFPDNQSFLFISLFRSGKYAKAFSQRDVAIKQKITLHLYASWKSNLQAEIERMRIPNQLLHASTAFLDSEGSILCSDAAFNGFVNELWPHWKEKGRVPLGMLDEGWICPSGLLQVKRLCAGGLERIDISRQPLFNKLTKREKQIALEYADGKSYKEIAAGLALSPTTVRHYLQVIYTKLDINDKSELVRFSDAYSRSAEMMRWKEAARQAALPLVSGM
ncbi:response regulator transcription factor [Methylobacillus pratensis]